LTPCSRVVHAPHGITPVAVAYPVIVTARGSFVPALPVPVQLKLKRVW